MSSSTLDYFKRRGRAIAAPATPTGGPVAVVRVSGSDLSFLESLLGSLPEAGTFSLRKIEFQNPRGENLREKALVLRFRAPNSFTGEDVIEIQGHGVTNVVTEIIEEICRRGASPALPGEFSFRAVLNNKMTLIEAEALQTALSTEGLGASWAANFLDVQASAAVGLHERFEGALARLASARGRVEAAIDFPEAEAEQAADIASAQAKVKEVWSSLQALLTTFENFSAGAGAPIIAICGRPNVGKSTLLNLLSGGERALVSALPGTTRDIVEISYRLPSGRRIRLLDTAGLREFGKLASPHDELEARGISLGRDAIAKSSAVVLLERSGEDSGLAPELALKPLIRLFSHADEALQPPKEGSFDLRNQAAAVKNWLDRRMDAILGENLAPSADFVISRRQAELMKSALRELQVVDECLRGQAPLEVAGTHLRRVEELLKRGLGRDVGDEYIGEIFSQFCLGK